MDAAALTIGLSPYAIYGNVGYTEPMFLMLTCACFVALHAEKHVWAGCAGALLGAVRFAGMAAVPLNPGVIDTEMLRQCWSDEASAYPKADAWAKVAAPFILGLNAKHNGQSLSVGGDEG